MKRKNYNISCIHLQSIKTEIQKIKQAKSGHIQYMIMNFQTAILFPIMVIIFTINFADASGGTLAILNNNAAVVQPSNFLKDSSNNNIQKSVKTIPSSSSSSKTRSTIGNNQNFVSALSSRKEERTTSTDNVPAPSSSRSTFLRGSLVSAPLAFISSLMAAEEANAKSTSLTPKEKSLKSKSVDDFVGSYSDPKHPGCSRTISVNEKKTLYVVDGQDGNPGCSNPKKTKDWVIPAVPSNSGRTASFDFSVKKGPKNIMGMFFETNNEAVGGKTYKGIYFEDGNIWTKIAD